MHSPVVSLHSLLITHHPQAFSVWRQSVHLNHPNKQIGKNKYGSYLDIYIYNLIVYLSRFTVLPVSSTASINSEGTRSGVKWDNGSGADTTKVDYCQTTRTTITTTTIKIII